MNDNGKEKRSFNMSRIRSENTKPEIRLRKALFDKGFRYRLHKKSLPGTPDIIFSKNKLAVFVHGCFWHLHENCKDGRLPKSRLDYWEPKLKKNVERDRQNIQDLINIGWTVLIVWECEINKDVTAMVKEIEKIVSSR